MAASPDPPTRASLIASLDAVLFELGKMENALRESSEIGSAEKRHLRAAIGELFARADALMQSLVDQRAPDN